MGRRSIIFLLALVCASQAVSFLDLVIEEWNTFKVQYKKKYDSSTEEKFRLKMFMENREKIAKHNARFEQGEVSFKLALNEYGDMLHYEFADMMNGFNRTKNKKNYDLHKPLGAKFISPANVELPDKVDWRDLGAVTEVKNQGHCASCWAFSVTGSLEGQHYRKTGVLTSLSEQNLIDCSERYGNYGCHGGVIDFAFQYIRDNGGIDTEASYPYEGVDDQCRYTPAASGATDSGFVDVPRGSERRLMEAVATIGPISVAIDASHESFQLYHSGVYFEPKCSSEILNHGVLIVGYGTTDDGHDYWLIKNSWGTSWGEKGYMKMARNKDNHCGVATEASFPLV